MSNRSYPADFSRPLCEVPVATDEDVQRMLERLRRRCKVGKTSSQQGHEEARPRAELSFDLAPASSADTPTSAGGSHVSATAEKTACAGGGYNGVEHTAGSPFQPTRPAPNNPTVNTGPCGNHGSDPGLGDVGAERRSIRHGGPSQGPGSGCEAGDVPSLVPSVPALQWERVSSNAMRTTCGVWTCCKVTMMGKPQYELFRRIAGLERPTRILNPFKSFEDAKAAAQDEMDRDDT